MTEEEAENAGVLREREGAESLGDDSESLHDREEAESLRADAESLRQRLNAVSLRQRITRQGEEALGKLAQDLLENSLVSGTISRAFEARERATQAQEAAMGALNLPSAADIERLTRRLRSVSQRLEGIEDALDKLDRRLEGLGGGETNGSGNARLTAIETQLAKLVGEVSHLSAHLNATPSAPPREQERLRVDHGDATVSGDPGQMPQSLPGR